MTYDSTRHHRRSIRLRGYDYRQAGAYFVTICTQNRQYLFGDVVDGQTVLNGPGEMVDTVWCQLPQHYPGVQVDAFVVMPNHIHGISILLVGAGAPACPGRPQGVAPTDGDPGRPQGVAPMEMMSLSDVMHRFKSLTTARYRQGVVQGGWPPFRGRVWQRNYHERIIRDDEELGRIRQHIVDNPARWMQDPENPGNIGAHGHAPPPSDPR